MSTKNDAYPDFPFLSETERFLFPPPEKAKNSSVICWGGNLSPGMLLSAYEQGLFPWYSEGEPILWHSPDPRFILFPEKLHTSSSMKKVLNQKKYTVTFNRDFSGVINECSKIERRHQAGTWINPDMIAAYTELHRLGWAHSAEAYTSADACNSSEASDSTETSNWELAGGCYGILIGKVFFGESMFARKPNASKAAFLTLARILFDGGIRFIDCQQPTLHLESLGAEIIPRKDFISLLRETLNQ